MAVKTLPHRAEIPAEFKWNLEAIYPDEAQWELDLAAAKLVLDTAGSFRGRLNESPQVLLEALRLRDDLSQRLEKLYSYARMRRDEDNANPHYQALEDRSRSHWTRAEETLAYLNPELLHVGRSKIESFMQQEPDLRLYEHALDDLFREQEHLLNAEGEALLAGSSEIAAGAGQIYDMLTDADMAYGTITDEEGQQVELTQARYLRYIRSLDRRVREEAFHTLHGAYEANRNTIGSCYSTQVKSDIFYSRARKYQSSLEAALFHDNIPTSVYENLIRAVHENLPLLHRYMELRKRALHLPELHMYDLHVPIVMEVDQSFPYERATEIVAAAVGPMGNDYMDAVRQGFASRWTDVYETPNKTSGAYSWGVYGVHPFMLLNYQENLRDVFTLAHEMGHSIHTYFSYKHQPYIYSNYTLFVAEVASTLNEELLSHYLLNSTDDTAVRLAVINHSLEQFRTTLYRQTMFAEFEKLAHERAESGQALTAESLSEIHFELNRLYHGEGVVVDKDIAIEWARIPHFFRSFYVYKYATGMSAAVALSQQILSEGKPAVDRYLHFLGSGGSDYSIDLLKQAGIDMTSPEPVRHALQLFGERIEQMEQLMGLS